MLTAWLWRIYKTCNALAELLHSRTQNNTLIRKSNRSCAQKNRWTRNNLTIGKCAQNNRWTRKNLTVRRHAQNKTPELQEVDNCGKLRGQRWQRVGQFLGKHERLVHRQVIRRPGGAGTTWLDASFVEVESGLCLVVWLQATFIVLSNMARDVWKRWTGITNWYNL